MSEVRGVHQTAIDFTLVIILSMIIFLFDPFYGPTLTALFLVIYLGLFLYFNDRQEVIQSWMHVIYLFLGLLLFIVGGQRIAVGDWYGGMSAVLGVILMSASHHEYRQQGLEKLFN